MKKCIIALLALSLYYCAPTEKQTEKPNIVFIFADDLTYSAINALGNTEIQTPNLNTLVDGGTTFTHAYNMGAWDGAVCAASRAMMISGRSVWDVNKFRKNWNKTEAIDKTWGKIMERAGYDTYMTGKWHVGAPADSVFNNVVHVRPGMPQDSWNRNNPIPFYKDLLKSGVPRKDIKAIGYNRPLNVNDTMWNPTDKKYGGYWEGGKHWSEVLKDDALGFIDSAKNSDKPFFMYLAFNAPHDPRQAPQDYIDKYPLDAISIPKSFIPMYPYKDAMGSGKDLRDEALAPFPRTAYAVKKHTQEYYALITHLDHQIGVILEGLKASGKMDNTYIIFTADHGLAMGKHGLMGKQSQFDHSIRAPFMVVGPNVPKNKKINTDIYLQDAMATSLELAGVKKPEYVYFNSVLDLINQENPKSHYNGIYGGYIKEQRMIRKDGFKLIVYPKIKKVLLFDMNSDPEEMNDLANIPEYKNKVAMLFKDLLQLQKELNDPLDITSCYEL